MDLRRKVIAVGCTLTAVALLLWNMPVPEVRGQYRDATDPAYALVRLEQDWGLFAPDVSQSSLFLHLEVVGTNGEVTRLDFPDGEPFIGTYRAYRWSAYEETLIDDEFLQDKAFDWALDQVDAPDSVERVDLVAVESDISSGSHGPFEPDYDREVVASREVS